MGKVSSQPGLQLDSETRCSPPAGEPINPETAFANEMGATTMKSIWVLNLALVLGLTAGLLSLAGCAHSDHGARSTQEFESMAHQQSPPQPLLNVTAEVLLGSQSQMSAVLHVAEQRPSSTHFVARGDHIATCLTLPAQAFAAVRSETQAASLEPIATPSVVSELGQSAMITLSDPANLGYELGLCFRGEEFGDGLHFDLGVAEWGDAEMLVRHGEGVAVMIPGSSESTAILLLVEPTLVTPRS